MTETKKMCVPNICYFTKKNDLHNTYLMHKTAKKVAFYKKNYKVCIQAKFIRFSHFLKFDF